MIIIVEKFPGVRVSFLVHRQNGSNFGNHYFIVRALRLIFIEVLYSLADFHAARHENTHSECQAKF